MDYGEAVSRISEIHDHLAKGEVYRGFRSLPMAASGVLGLCAALGRPFLFDSVSDTSLVGYWSAVAVLCAAVGGAETVYNYAFRDDVFARRRTRKVLGQFAPCLGAAAAVTFCLTRGQALSIGFLPGLWASFFGLGLFAARPYLPRAIGWVALYYIFAAFALLLAPSLTQRGFDLQIGGVFGLGQIAAAVVFYWNLERNENVAR